MFIKANEDEIIEKNEIGSKQGNLGIVVFWRWGGDSKAFWDEPLVLQVRT